jgi:hypothetical protein
MWAPASGAVVLVAATLNPGNAGHAGDHRAACQLVMHRLRQLRMLGCACIGQIGATATNGSSSRGHSIMMFLRILRN